MIEWLPTTRTCNCKEGRLNCLTGGNWVKRMWSIWKVKENHLFDKHRKKHHPASFSVNLAKEVIALTTHKGETVLDPFAGIGSCLEASKDLGRNSVGIELSQEYIGIYFKLRAVQKRLFSDTKTIISCDDAVNLDKYIPPESIDLMFTSPPYWDMMKQKKTQLIERQKRTTFAATQRTYSTKPNDLGNMAKLDDFLGSLRVIMGKVYKVLKFGKYAVINIGDIYKQGKFYPLSHYTIDLMESVGFILDNIVIWDRKSEYSSQIFGYPSRFVTLKCHEYLLFFKKPLMEVNKNGKRKR